MMSQPVRQNVMRKTVAANIRAARQAKGYTQRELARRVNNVDTLAVWRWEKGTVLPSPKNFIALAEAVERDVAWFYTVHEKKKKAA